MSEVPTTPAGHVPETRASRSGEVPLTRARLKAMQAARHALKVPPVPRDFRSDIEGMRAIAVVGVMLWHAGVPLLPGGFVGVDVFFVVSGFLMTALLLEEARARGRIDLGRFYARRARRLLPAALTALLGTALLTVALIPRTRWGEIGGDLLASAGYVVNWRLSQRSVDYLDLDRAPSPVQHYWSLSVEEQFYVLWPILLLLVLLLARGRAKVFVGWSWGITLAILVASLGLSWWWTGHNAAQAYFVTPTRVHELMLGAVVALGARSWPRLPRALAAALGWVGLAMIVTALFVIDSATPFPGTAALLPTVGTALVIVSGFAAGGLGPDLVLRAGVLQWTGRISYSLYLWHWPFVAAAASLAHVGSGGPQHLPVHWGLLAVLVSVVPAWLSFRYVEEPVRVRGRQLASRLPQGVVTQRTLRLGLNCTLAGVLAGILLMTVAPGTGTSGPVAWRTPAVVEELRAPVGAGTLAAGGAGSDEGAGLGSGAGTGTASGHVGVDSGSSLGSGGQRLPQPQIPDRLGTLAIPLEQVRDDLPVLQPEGCFVGITGSQVGVCEAGDPDGTVTVALSGDSHAAMWVTALDKIGRDRGWRVLVLAKSSCPPAPGMDLPREGQPDGYAQCRAYQEDLGPRLVELDPDVVLLSSASYGRVEPADLASAMAERVDELRRAGIVPAIIRDVPRPPFDVPECLVSNSDHVAECAFPRADALERAGTGQDELVALRPTLPVVDLNDAVCPAATCSPVVGGVVVWRDSNHLSATYVDSLRDLVEERVAPVVRTARLPEPARSPLLEGERLGRS
ncbi:SGNH hydrolase domain-containing protein [Ornithinimicrobium humiphilum]|uniref:Peptidoglycan/LPS O-acetylase OafA/YrhL n=1 Tax=Ornithinimicrobium humiphilum TaxID=125288 RepID=A0A543KJC9_9MICO|nr:acyltransferase family protein [Ornithinimicrobium humiphilum]TQM95188.1 peptidoglycan/LPS O-acetylase OafA/YrhL [Ornithinimicrobium humiphilum]